MRCLQSWFKDKPSGGDRDGGGEADAAPEVDEATDAEYAEPPRPSAFDTQGADLGGQPAEPAAPVTMRDFFNQAREEQAQEDADARAQHEAAAPADPPRDDDVDDYVPQEDTLDDPVLEEEAQGEPRVAVGDFVRQARDEQPDTAESAAPEPHSTMALELFLRGCGQSAIRCPCFPQLKHTS